MPSRTSRILLVALALAAFTGCGGAPYVWVQELPQTAAAEEYVIASGDVLNVRVFNQENMSTRAKVRSDGMIAVPFIGEVMVRGKTPAAVSADLETRFKRYVVSAPVTLTVEESAPSSVSVLGEVTHPGAYTVDGSAGVLQALAVAGGFTDFANRGSIYLLRRSPSQRIRFTYASLTQGDERASGFRLRAGDVLVVE